MASTLAFLLHLEPTQAIVRMLNDANGTNYRLDRFTASAPTVIAGTTTKVTLSSVEVPAYIDDQVTTGSIDFTYERLELSVFLKGVLDGYHPTLPCSTQTLLDEIKARINQSFYGDDILLQELTRDNGVQYALTAKPESLRFVGSITLPLLQVVDISTLFDPNLIASSTATAPYVPNLDDAAAYVTGTDILNQDTTVNLGSVVQSPSVLLQVIQQQVPDPVTGQYHAPWYADSSAPGPYNLYGAIAQYRGTIELPGTTFQYEIPGTTTHVLYTWPELCNTAIPTLDSAVVLAVNPSYCTNFKGTLTIPYSSADFDYTPTELAADKVANPSRPNDWFEIPGDGFVAKPRLTHNSVVSLSNGTTWQNYLNANWSTGDVIYSFQTTPPITMDGSSAWVATVGGLTYTNLYGATVVYNGQLRAEDLPAATVGLDRVMVVDFTGSDNSLWTGQYPFYYQSPIEISGTSFTSTVGSAVHLGLLAVGEAVTVLEVAADGTTLPEGTSNLPTGLTLDRDAADWFVGGTPTTEGSYTYYLQVKSGSLSVFYTISHVVKTAIVALSLQGDLTPGVEGDAAWVSYIDIEGGLAPYTLGTITGDLPASITAQIQYDTVHLYGTWNDNGIHHFNLEVSSTDGQSITRSFTFQATGTALGVTASESLNDAYFVGDTVSGNYTVVGGTAPYTYQTSSGTFPPGLLLNGGTGSVSSTLTATGSFTWTVTVTSSDGFVGSVTSTITVSLKDTYEQAVLDDNPAGYWKLDDFAGTATSPDLSGPEQSGTLVDSSGYNHPSSTAGSYTYPTLRLNSTGSMFDRDDRPRIACADVLPSLAQDAEWCMEGIFNILGWGNYLQLFSTEGQSSNNSHQGIIQMFQSSDGSTLFRGAANTAVVTTSPVVSAGISALRNGDTGVKGTRYGVFHLIWQNRAGTNELYVNGTLQGTVANAGHSFGEYDGYLYFGGTPQYFDWYPPTGSRSDLAVYAHSLTPQRIQVHAQAAGLYAGS